MKKLEKTVQLERETKFCCMPVENICQVRKYATIGVCNLLSQKCRKVAIVSLVTFREKGVYDNDLENDGITI